MSGRQKSILLIHHSTALIEALTCFFRSFDILVASSTTARDGLRLFHLTRPDHAIIHTGLPGAPDLIRTIHSRQPSLDIVIVAESDEAADAVRSLGYDKIVLAADPLDHVADSIILLLEDQVSEPRSNAASVLVVDDENETLDVIARYLAQKGYSTLTAESGQEAIQTVELNPQISIVVLDLVMPEMGGIETLRTITERPGSPGVIMMSPLADREVVRAVHSLGAFDYIPKPVDLARLDSSIIACLAHSEYRKRPWWRRLVDG